MNKRQIWGQKLVQSAAFICAVLMLCAVPLYTQDAFFDINRCKVSLVRTAVPPLVAAMAGALILRGKKFDWRMMPFAAMGAFLISCVLSGAHRGFIPEVLEGSAGRYCGLIYLLCCGGAFYVMALGDLDGRIVTALMLASAGFCAGLGVLNAMGIDPFGFYDRIKRGQESAFLSTIGNLDFFGTYLAVMFGPAVGLFVFSKKIWAQVLALLVSLVMMAGMYAARTDGAWLGMHMVLFAAAAVSGGDYRNMARASVLWGLGFAVLPIVNKLLTFSPYKPRMSGLPLILCETHAAWVLAGAFLLLGLVFFLLKKRSAPGRKTIQKTALFVLCLALILFFGAMFYFSVMNPDAAIGELSGALRFNDSWGSARGFVYQNSLRAYGDYTLSEKLFGNGVDYVAPVLAKYMDKSEMIAMSGGVFNDVHCQPLQMLLTCGLLGMVSFLFLYGSLVVTIFRHAGEDPILLGCLASLIGYLPVMLFNVTQPILIAAYFSLGALALSRIRACSGGLKP